MKFINPVILIKANATEGKKVYVSEESIKRVEFYQAKTTGNKVEKVICIRSFEYANEETVQYGNDRYTVLRSYNANDGIIELVLVRENRLYPESAVLIWHEVKEGLVIEKRQDVHVRYTGYSRKSFDLAYQVGTLMSYGFKLSKDDYELSRRIDTDTKKPIYASKIEYDNAEYDITQSNFNPDINEVEVICS